MPKLSLYTNLVLAFLLSFSTAASSKQLVILYADPIILKFSDGSKIEINALAEVDAGTVRNAPHINGERMDRKSVPPGNEFGLSYDEPDVAIRARCKMSGAGMVRDPRGLEELYPVVCRLKMNGEKLGKLVLQNRAEVVEDNT